MLIFKCDICNSEIPYKNIEHDIGRVLVDWQQHNGKNKQFLPHVCPTCINEINHKINAMKKRFEK